MKTRLVVIAALALAPRVYSRRKRIKRAYRTYKGWPVMYRIYVGMVDGQPVVSPLGDKALVEHCVFNAVGLRIVNAPLKKEN